MSRHCCYDEYDYCENDGYYRLKKWLKKKFPCDAPRPIHCVPFCIEKPGKYCVTRDLCYYGHGAAILVKANNVTINFANHDLLLKENDAVGVKAEGVEELTLENDKIYTPEVSTNSASAAVHLKDCTKVLLDNLLTQNTFFGVLIDNCDDVKLQNSRGEKHIGGSFPDLSAAVKVVNSRQVTVDNCTFLGPGNGLLEENTYVGGSSTTVLVGDVLDSDTPASDDVKIINSSFEQVDGGVTSFLCNKLLIEKCVFDAMTMSYTTYAARPFEVLVIFVDDEVVDVIVPDPAPFFPDPGASLNSLISLGSSKDVVVRDNTLKGPFRFEAEYSEELTTLTASYLTQTAINLVRGQHVKIVNNVLSNYTGHGISSSTFNDTSNPNPNLARDILIKGNNFNLDLGEWGTVFNNSPLTSDNNGISLRGSEADSFEKNDNGKLRNINVIDNVINGGLRFSIFMDWVTDVLIQGNTTRQSGGCSVILFDADNVDILDNTFNEAGTNSIQFWDTNLQDITIRGNNIQGGLKVPQYIADFGVLGVFFYPPDPFPVIVQLEGQYIVRNSSGIYMGGYDPNQVNFPEAITRNVLIKNNNIVGRQTGISVYYSDGVTVENNTVANTESDGIQVQGQTFIFPPPADPLIVRPRNVNILNNTVSNVGFDGIWLNSLNEEITVCDNKVVNAEVVGIRISTDESEDPCNILLKGNETYKNEAGIVVNNPGTHLLSNISCCNLSADYFGEVGTNLQGLGVAPLTGYNLGCDIPTPGEEVLNQSETQKLSLEKKDLSKDSLTKQKGTKLSGESLAKFQEKYPELFSGKLATKQQAKDHPFLNRLESFRNLDTSKKAVLKNVEQKATFF